MPLAGPKLNWYSFFSNSNIYTIVYLFSTTWKCLIKVLSQKEARLFTLFPRRHINTSQVQGNPTQPVWRFSTDSKVFVVPVSWTFIFSHHFATTRIARSFLSLGDSPGLPLIYVSLLYTPVLLLRCPTITVLPSETAFRNSYKYQTALTWYSLSFFCNIYTNRINWVSAMHSSKSFKKL